MKGVVGRANPRGKDRRLPEWAQRLLKVRESPHRGGVYTPHRGRDVLVGADLMLSPGRVCDRGGSGSCGLGGSQL
jgi:hypothetical protein